METPGRKRIWKTAVGAAKLVIVALVVWYVRRTLVDAWEQLGERRWQLDFRWLVASGVLYLLGTLPCGIFWHRTLAVLGQKVPLRRALRAYYIGHLGKYVPGKALVVVLRAGMVRQSGGDVATAAIAVFFETLTMMSAGAFWAAAIVAVWFAEHATLFWAAIAMMFAAGLPTLPPVFKRLVFLLRVHKTSPGVAERLGALGYRTWLLGWLLSSLGWLVLAISLWAVLQAFGQRDGLIQAIPMCMAAVTLATVAGFVSFVPGGAVVREAVLTELMAPYVGRATALLSAVVLRVVQIVAELIISGMLYLERRVE